MYEPPSGYEAVFTSTSRQECLESRLVLDAAGVAYEAVHRDGSWFLIVASSDAANSAAELSAYLQENRRSGVHPKPIATYGGAATAVWVYSGILLFIAFLETQSAFGVQWLPAGRMQAGEVMAGEWWRAVTALTLHLDAGHILGNLVFGGVFGYLAGRILGGGVAWLAIVLAGTLGNLINAMVQPPSHSSIGASTAVFAALGVMVSHALRPAATVREKRFKRWSPLIGGVLLLALTGVGGERTDVAAHLTGFLAGMLIGWIGWGVPSQWLASARIQKASGLSAIAILVLAWVIALSHAIAAEN